MEFGGYASYTTRVIKNGLFRLEALYVRWSYDSNCMYSKE